MAQLFISDLDGTLLRNDATLSDYARHHLERMLESGLPFSIATARSLTSVQQIIGDLPVQLPIVCANGAYMADLKSGEHAFTQSLPTETAAHILETVARERYSSFVSAYNGSQRQLYFPRQRDAGAQWYWKERSSLQDPRLREVDKLEHSLNDQVICLSIINRMENIMALKARFAEQFPDQLEMYVYHDVPEAGWGWLSIYDHQSTKANGIRHISQVAGYEIGQTIVFGDQNNDISMFRMAGKGVAMGNAIEALKEVAHEIIGTNEEDSVVNYLRNLTDHS
ncbi:MAG: HAD family hydrolase [Bacteroidota bacterium]